MYNILQSPEQVGLLLQSARKHRGFTQVELGRYLGVSQSRFSKIEQDPQGMSVAQFLTLCGQLGLEVSVRDKAAAAVNSGASDAPQQAPAAKAVEW